MHKKLSENYYESSNLNHTIFDSIQYDVLRRLRAYWVARFVLNKLKNIGKDYGYIYPLPPITPYFSRQSTYISMSSSVKRAPIYLTSNSQQPTQILTENDIKLLDQSSKNVLFEKCKEALHTDKAAGGPFLRFISR
jgi:hypothetical protein